MAARLLLALHRTLELVLHHPGHRDVQQGSHPLPRPAGPAIRLPQNGSALTYATLTTVKTSQGNITAASTDSYSFQQIGNQWNVTETISSKITCSPPAAQLSVRFRTTSDFMGANSAVSNDPNIKLKVSYMIQDRIIKSTPVGSNVPAGYSAKCTLGGNDLGSVGQVTGALYASTLRYYVLFYIQTTGVTEGTLVPISLLTVTISGTQNVAVLNTSRLALVGTLTGLTSGSVCWDKESGILLLEESTTGTESEKMLLINSTYPFTATSATTSAATTQATSFTSATSLMSSISATEIQTPLESRPLTTTGLIGLGLVALVAIVGLAIALHRRQSVSEKTVERPELRPAPEYITCRFCGGKIPQGKVRCPDCGRFW